MRFLYCKFLSGHRLGPALNRGRPAGIIGDHEHIAICFPRQALVLNIPNCCNYLRFCTPVLVFGYEFRCWDTGRLSTTAGERVEVGGNCSRTFGYVRTDAKCAGLLFYECPGGRSNAASSILLGVLCAMMCSRLDSCHS